MNIVKYLYMYRSVNFSPFNLFQFTWCFTRSRYENTDTCGDRLEVMVVTIACNTFTQPPKTIGSYTTTSNVIEVEFRKIVFRSKQL